MPSVGKTIPHDSAVGHVTGQAPYIDDLPATGRRAARRLRRQPRRGRRAERRRRVRGPRRPRRRRRAHRGRRPGPQPVRPARRSTSRSSPSATCCTSASRSPSSPPNRAKPSLAAQRPIKLDVTEQPPLLDLDESIRPGALPRRPRAASPAATATPSSPPRPHRLSGTFHSGGQEQFYLESQAAIAYPGEEGQMVVHSSTQNPTEIQAVVAEMLGLGQHEVVCICKRMGGGFGGKETQAAIPAMMAALVAHNTRPPGPRHLQQRRRHARHRQAAPVPHPLGSRLRRRRPHPRPASSTTSPTAAARPTSRRR